MLNEQREHVYTSSTVIALYEDQKKEAIKALSSIEIGKKAQKVGHNGLTGWVFEQVVRYCLMRDLKERGIFIDDENDIEEQYKLEGRKRIDFRFGKALVEVKANGSYGQDADKYSGYRKDARGKNMSLIYLTKSETHKPYRDSINKALNTRSVFMLSENGDWERFVDRVIEINSWSSKKLHS